MYCICVYCIVYILYVSSSRGRANMNCDARVDESDNPYGDNLMGFRRTDYTALSQDPLDVRTLLHVHSCPDVTIPSFPFGPLLRDTGTCGELIPIRCAFCSLITYQPCRTTYRVAHTGADWNGIRDADCKHQEMCILVQCSHCHAPSDFHIQLALFKEYYEEVFDYVRKGFVTLFDIRRSITAVSYWPPQSGFPLARRLSHLASQVSEALCIDTALPRPSSSLVLQYWQGVEHDFLSPCSSFTRTLEMYDCTHAWPCANSFSVTRPCMWMRWSEHWLQELHICDMRRKHRGRFALPRFWDEWIETRRPDWMTRPEWNIERTRSGLPTELGPWGRHDSFGDGATFLNMATTHTGMGPVLKQFSEAMFTHLPRHLQDLCNIRCVLHSHGLTQLLGNGGERQFSTRVTRWSA